MSDTKIPLRTVMNQDGGAILDVGRGTITTLNQTGAFVWQQMERGVPFPSILDALAQETGEDVANIEKDVREFIEMLKDKHLLPIEPQVLPS